MKLTRDQIPELVSDVLACVPVRWSPPRAGLSVYDGHERTLEVFNVPAREQRVMLRRLRTLRDEIDAAAGGDVVFLFHTPEESKRLHREFVDSFARLRVSAPAIEVQEATFGRIPASLVDIAAANGSTTAHRKHG